MQSTYADLLSADNANRTRAEEQLNAQSVADPAALASSLVEGMKDASNVEVASLCLVLIKKYFLDPRSQVALPETHLEAMRAAVTESIEFTNQALSVLKRKADVLCKLHYKLNKNQDLLALLLQTSNSEEVKARQFAMYAFEVISEVSLSEEELTAAQNEFMTIFKKALEDKEVSVKVAALKAITAFVSSINDSEIVLGF
jgi:hypothetical protein